MTGDMDKLTNKLTDKWLEERRSVKTEDDMNKSTSKFINLLKLPNLISEKDWKMAIIIINSLLTQNDKEQVHIILEWCLNEAFLKGKKGKYDLVNSIISELLLKSFYGRDKVIELLKSKLGEVLSVKDPGCDVKNVTEAIKENFGIGELRSILKEHLNEALLGSKNFDLVTSISSLIQHDYPDLDLFGMRFGNDKMFLVAFFEQSVGEEVHHFINYITKLPTGTPRAILYSAYKRKDVITQGSGIFILEPLFPVKMLEQLILEYTKKELSKESEKGKADNISITSCTDRIISGFLHNLFLTEKEIKALKENYGEEKVNSIKNESLEILKFLKKSFPRRFLCSYEEQFVLKIASQNIPLVYTDESIESILSFCPEDYLSDFCFEMLEVLVCKWKMNAENINIIRRLVKENHWLGHKYEDYWLKPTTDYNNGLINLQELIINISKKPKEFLIETLSNALNDTHVLIQKEGQLRVLELLCSKIKIDNIINVLIKEVRYKSKHSGEIFTSEAINCDEKVFKVILDKKSKKFAKKMLKEVVRRHCIFQNVDCCESNIDCYIGQLKMIKLLCEKNGIAVPKDEQELINSLKKKYNQWWFNEKPPTLFPCNDNTLDMDIIILHDEGEPNTNLEELSYNSLKHLDDMVPSLSSHN